MALDYKLEFAYDNTTAADASVFIHLKHNPPIYQERIDKEDYDILDAELQHEFLVNILSIAGVTEISSRAYRIWIMKSPAYSWEDIIEPTLYYMKNWFGEDSINPLPGSANTDGTGGITLSDINQRRKL